MAFSSESIEQEQELDTSEDQQEKGEERVQPISGVIGDAELTDMGAQRLVPSSDEDSDDDDYIRNRQQEMTKWWFQQPAVKKNWFIVVLTIAFLIVGICIFVTGIGLEVTYHTGMDDVIRGFIFIVVSFILLLPSVYAILHIYLAAKKVGRVRFSSVWFFTN